jgi:hypothetical protein
MADQEKIREIEAQIAELERRWPAHSVPPNLWQELERLENELEEARENEGVGPDAG